MDEEEITLTWLNVLLKDFIEKYPFITVKYKWDWNMEAYMVSVNFDEEGKADVMWEDLQEIHDRFEENPKIVFTVNEELFEVPGPYKILNIQIVRNEKFQSNSKRRW